MKKNKKAAMEMSVGTIVTIVLLVSVLVLGIILINRIFKGATSAVDLTNAQLTDQINQLFSQDTSTRMVVYPQTRQISIAKGDSGGFGFSIRNIDPKEHTFSYEVKVVQVASSCTMSTTDAQNLIILGDSGSGIKIPSGDKLQNAILVKINVPHTASLCDIRYGIDVKEDGIQYLPTVTVDLQIT